MPVSDFAGKQCRPCTAKRTAYLGLPDERRRFEPPMSKDKIERPFDPEEERMNKAPTVSVDDEFADRSMYGSEEEEEDKRIDEFLDSEFPEGATESPGDWTGRTKYKPGFDPYEGKLKRKAIDNDRVPANLRRHRIDQHIGRVSHVGHPFKGNDVVFAPNDRVYQDLQEGRKPHGSSPYTVQYFTDRALGGLKAGGYWDGDAAFLGTCGSEEARWMSDEQKTRLAESIRGYGYVVKEESLKEALKGNDIEKLHRQDTGDIDIVS